jgi:hypothetical protein
MLKPLIGVFLLSSTAFADVTGCACDVAHPESAKVRMCSLCLEAEKHPAGIAHFFLKDNNPRKPNRWLILPRSHAQDGPGIFPGMSRAERTALWKAAIARAEEMWGDGWGLAINGSRSRTQCHAHIHIGKLLGFVELDRRFAVVSRAEDIPVPEDGTGLWVHPVEGKLHVHLGEQTCETVLMR